MTEAGKSESLVSIIMPTYRQAAYLGASIHSALAQTHKAIEIIVVDDGSDDDTAGVVWSFGDRVRYLRQKNAGPAASRNNGLSVATGKYILFLDSDDLLHREAVAWLVEAAGGREDTLSVMGIRWFSDDADLVSGRVDQPPLERAAAARKLLLQNLNPPLAYLCSRSMVQKVGGFDPGKNVDACEDWDLWAKLYFAGAEIKPIDRLGAHYRRHPNSHGSNRIRNWNSGTEVMWRSVAHLRADPRRVESDGLKTSEMLRAMRHKLALDYRDMAFALREEGLYRRALRGYRLSLTRGHLNAAALGGIMKLPLHWLSRGRFFRPAKTESGAAAAPALHAGGSGAAAVGAATGTNQELRKEASCASF